MALAIMPSGSLQLVWKVYQRAGWAGSKGILQGVRAFWSDAAVVAFRAKRTEGAARSPGRPAAWRFEGLRNVLGLHGFCWDKVLATGVASPVPGPAITRHLLRVNQ